MKAGTRTAHSLDGNQECSGLDESKKGCADIRRLEFEAEKMRATDQDQGPNSVIDVKGTR